MSFGILLYLIHLIYIEGRFPIDTILLTLALWTNNLCLLVGYLHHITYVPM